MSAPPFAYYGGKTKLASRIVELLPAHEHYVEPFAGGLSVLLEKSRSAIETVNDLDQDLVTFWRVLRDRPDALMRVCELTPHSRIEYANAYNVDVDDLERARRVWIVLSQGRGGTLRNTGWRVQRNPAGSHLSMAERLAAYVDRIPACALRLHGVSIECRPALEVIREYGPYSDVLLYCDPPYLRSSRNSTNYRHEMSSVSEHEELAAALKDCRASVVLSGYADSVMDTLYADWHKLELPAWTGNGIRSGATKTDGARIEVLWSNRPFASDDVLDFGASA